MTQIKVGDFVRNIYTGDFGEVVETPTHPYRIGYYAPFVRVVIVKDTPKPRNRTWRRRNIQLVLNVHK